MKLPGMCLLALALLGLACVESADAELDYSNLRLKANGLEQDSVSVALLAAASLLGVTADYDTAACDTSNAFAPAVDPSEGCMAWWHLEAWNGDHGIDLAAARLGLKARRLVGPPFHGVDSDPIHRRSEVALNVSRLLDTGHVVLACGGWQYQTPSGFVPWGWAGIVTKVRADGTLVGACLNGRDDNPLGSPSELWSLSSGARKLDPKEADLRMLSRAVARIRGTRPFTQAHTAVYGLDAVDLWVHQMETVPGFCQPCQQRSGNGWTCAADNARLMRADALTASRRLLACMNSLPTQARPHLESAAQRYRTIAVMLEPCLASTGTGAYRACVGSLTKQREHSSLVLRPLRRELEGIASELSAAMRVSREQPAVTSRRMPE